MLLFNYFFEFKNRIILLILTWITTFIVCYNYKEIMLYIIIKPSCNTTIFKLNKIYFIATNVTEIFNTYIFLAYIFSNKILFFYFLFHFSLFIKNGLYKYEITLIKKCIFIYIIFSFFSILFLYYIILPLSWNFFFNFQELVFINQLNIHFESKLSEYLHFFKNLNKLSNILCQIFTITFIYINNVKNYLKIIKNNKKLSFLLLFTLTTLITPPDIFSQLILSSIIIIIFELFIIITCYYNLIRQSIKTN